MLCATELRGSVLDRWNGDGRNGLGPLADSCDVEGDQAEVRAGSCADDRGDDRHEPRRCVEPQQQRTRPGGPAGTTLESLTGRELQLAMLVVDRKTNPEIAGELFLSQKTVETHLRNIFRRVGVTSRVELARAVERAQRPTGASP